MSEQQVPEVPTTQEMLGQLAVAMAAADTAKAEITRIKSTISDELAPVQMDLDDMNDRIATLRALINERMTNDGVRTIETTDGRLQCQRAKTTKLTIVDVDRAQAHLADIDRLNECLVTTVDKDKVLWIAQTLPGGIEGVEEVTDFVFKATLKKAKP